jgi:hypothetical protein
MRAPIALRKAWNSSRRRRLLLDEAFKFDVAPFKQVLRSNASIAQRVAQKSIRDRSPVRYHQVRLGSHGQ